MIIRHLLTIFASFAKSVIMFDAASYVLHAPCSANVEAILTGTAVAVFAIRPTSIHGRAAECLVVHSNLASLASRACAIGIGNGSHGTLLADILAAGLIKLV